jgi:hypothetical protein
MPKKSTKKVAKKADEEEAAPEVEETEDAASVDDADEEEAASPKGAIDIVIMGKDGNLPGSIYIRQYSKAVHGKDFQALADEFCSKQPKRGGKLIAYTQVDASKIAKVEVRYREKEDAEKHIDKQDPDAPMVDKVKAFADKPEAVRFASTKRASTVVVSR